MTAKTNHQRLRSLLAPIRHCERVFERSEKHDGSNPHTTMLRSL